MFLIANNYTRWRCNFEGLSQDENHLKTFAPHSRKKIYRLICYPFHPDPLDSHWRGQSLADYYEVLEQQYKGAGPCFFFSLQLFLDGYQFSAVSHRKDATAFSTVAIVYQQRGACNVMLPVFATALQQFIFLQWLWGLKIIDIFSLNIPVSINEKSWKRKVNLHLHYRGR